MKKIAFLMALLLSICSFVACGTESQSGIKEDSSFLVENSTPTDAENEDLADSTVKDEAENVESCVSSPISIVVDQFNYFLSDEYLSVPLYYGEECNCDYYKKKPPRSYYGELWLGIQQPQEDDYLELIRTITSEELNSCEYCFKAVYGTGKYIYPSQKVVNIPISLLTRDEGTITIYYVLRDFYGDTVDFDPCGFVDIYYRKTENEIEIYDIKDPLGCSYRKEWKG